MLTVASIEPHPDQPRRHFDEEALDEYSAPERAAMLALSEDFGR